MKKSSLIFILIGCFIVGITATILITNYKRQKAHRQSLTELENSLPHNSPTDILRNYWLFASQNRLDEIRLLITKTPASFWVKCQGEMPNEYVLEDKSVDDEEFTGTLSHFSPHIRMMRLNRPKLSDLKVLNESVFEDEAVVEFIYLNNINRAFFKKIDGSWKLFEIGSFTIDFARFDEYAHPRPECENPETIFVDKSVEVEIAKPISNAKLPEVK